jgi:hypothetical protein
MFAFLANNPKVSSADSYTVNTDPSGTTTTTTTSSYSLKVEDPIPIKTDTTTSLNDFFNPSAPKLDKKTLEIVKEFERNFDDGELVLNFAILNKNHEKTESLEYIKMFYPMLTFNFSKLSDT